MQVFKNKAFSRWAAKEGLTDKVLCVAVDEMERGLIDANLGGHVVKKRVMLAGRGKRGGARTIVAYTVGHRAFFIYGFAKHAQANIGDSELKALKAYAAILVAFSDEELQRAVEAGALIEVSDNE